MNGFQIRIVAMLVTSMVLWTTGGCSRQGVPSQDKPRTGEKEEKVMPITMPTTPDVTVPQPAPKIGHLLGKGSLAMIKGDSLEVRDPAGKTIARGTLDTVLFPDRPWSPKGDALLYSKYSKQDVLRVLDFASGEDRFLARFPSNQLFPPYYWIEGGSRVLFHIYNLPGDAVAWVVGADGRGMQQLKPDLSDVRDAEYMESTFVTDVSDDGREVLVRGEKFADNGASLGSAVFLMDLATRKAVRVSPLDQPYCVSGKFADGGRKILLNCLRPVVGATYPSDVYLVDRDGSNPLKLAAGERGRVGLFVQGASRNGKWVAFMEQFMPNEPQSRSALYVLDTASNTKRTLIDAGPNKLLTPLGFGADDRSFLALVRDTGDGSMGGTLLRADVVTGRTEVMFDGVKAAFLAR